MNLILGTVALLSFRCLGVFGDCVTKHPDFDKSVDSCASWFTGTESYGQNTRANPRRYELLFRPDGATRHELLVRSEETDTEVMVEVKVYYGNEPRDQFAWTIGNKTSYHASVQKDCMMKITILQPTVATVNAGVIFSANNKTDRVTLSPKNVTFLRLEGSSPFAVCSWGSQEHCNGHKNSGSNDVEDNRSETQPHAGTNAHEGGSLHPTAASTEEAHLNSMTGGCNSTVITVLGVLLALSLLINKFFVIRFGLRKICSRRSDEGTNTNSAYRSQGLGNFPRQNSAHDSENSLYGAVINRR